MPTREETYRLSYALLQKTRDDSLAWETEGLLSSDENKAVYFLNAHGVNNAITNSVFAEQLLLGDYVLRDGIGLDLAFRLLKLGRTENLNGTDLIPKIIGQYKDRRIAVFGSSEQTLIDLKARLTKEGYTNIVAMEHGFHDDEHYVQACETAKPEILLLCMGMPRQEELSAKVKPHAKLTICGGGWADFYSGTKSRAPVWVQKINMEWFYRLANEPVRLGKRYTVDIVRYFFNVALVWRYRP